MKCQHNRYTVDAYEQTGRCYDCGSEGRMKFVVADPPPEERTLAALGEKVDLGPLPEPAVHWPDRYYGDDRPHRNGRCERMVGNRCRCRIRCWHTGEDRRLLPPPLNARVQSALASPRELFLMISTVMTKLKKSKAHRDAFVSSEIKVGLPFQIRALRKQRGWNQEQLAYFAGMLQPRISAMEQPGGGQLNLETLRKLASAFDVGLLVKFVPFSELAKWSEDFSPEEFSVASFDREWVEQQLLPRPA
jgi:transcriptional regulator with XRE-family HTH domain